MKYPILAAVASLLLVAITSPAQEPVPILLNYQGRVAVNGMNFDSATAGVPGKFRFELVLGDGTALYWRNSDDGDGDGLPDDPIELPVIKGLYSVMLGDVSIPHMAAIAVDGFAFPDLRLRVWFDDGVHGPQLLTPDQRL